MRLQHKDDEARNFLVPLSRQVVDAIAALRVLTGRGPSPSLTPAMSTSP